MDTDPAPAPAPAPADAPPAGGFAAFIPLAIGFVVVALLLAIGFRRRDIGDDAKPAEKPDDAKPAPPTDAHEHHEITPEMVEAAAAEKRAKREAQLRAKGFQPAPPPAVAPAPPAADEDKTPTNGAPIADEGAKA